MTIVDIEQVNVSSVMYRFFELSVCLETHSRFSWRRCFYLIYWKSARKIFKNFWKISMVSSSFFKKLQSEALELFCKRKWWVLLYLWRKFSNIVRVTILKGLAVPCFEILLPLHDCCITFCSHTIDGITKEILYLRQGLEF